MAVIGHHIKRKSMSRKPIKSILLNLPPDLAERIDVVVQTRYETRTHFIREAVRRNLRHYEKIERQQPKELTNKGVS
jgi:metal-responsive CopG/Arc/MetJ family transcriptional regulator